MGCRDRRAPDKEAQMAGASLAQEELRALTVCFICYRLATLVAWAMLAIRHAIRHAPTSLEPEPSALA